jgi:hypothetical protein
MSHEDYYKTTGWNLNNIPRYFSIWTIDSIVLFSRLVTWINIDIFININADILQNSYPGSVLSRLQTPILGINVPWLYLGMLFSSFCWHTEDNYLYSINYSHFGCTKQWYGVPGSKAKKFKDLVEKSHLITMKEQPDKLHHMYVKYSF